MSSIATRKATSEPVTAPFTVAVDSREKAPYRFDSLRADANKKSRELYVPTEWKTLPTGDYSIVGMESLVCVERKSLEDIFSTLGQNRERFEREHERMAAMNFAAVVIEADWETILMRPPEQSQLLPKCVFRTAISWMQRYGVPWLAMGSRGLAEATTFRILEKYWKESHQ